VSKLAISLCLILIFSIFIFCGSGETTSKTEPDNTEAYKKAAEERNAEYGYEPPEPFVPIESEVITAGNTIPGSSADIALRFATAFSDVDSSESYKFCNDTMQAVVRAFMITPSQTQSMLKTKEEGFKILSVKTLTNPNDTTACSACITALFMGAEVEDCSFQLRKTEGEWKVTDFGKQKQRQ